MSPMLLESIPQSHHCSVLLPKTVFGFGVVSIAKARVFGGTKSQKLGSRLYRGKINILA
jgi:hypothetical protein